MSTLRQSISAVSREIYGRYPVAHATNRIVVQLNNLISKLSCALDDDLHSLLTDEEGRGDLGKMYYTPEASMPKRVEDSDDDEDTDISRPPLLIRSSH